LVVPTETPEEIISWLSWLIRANKRKYQEINASDVGEGTRSSPGSGRISVYPRCRSQGFHLPRPLYDLQACALCYVYIPDKPGIFRPGAKWKSRRFEVVDEIDSEEGGSLSNHPLPAATERHHLFLLQSPDRSFWVRTNYSHIHRLY
jgi:hypothetical protein